MDKQIPLIYKVTIIMNSIINFLKSRRSVLIKSMQAGIMPKTDLESIIECGLRVPDHGMLSPWDIIIIDGKSRLELGQKCLRAEFARLHPQATDEMLAFEEARFTNASVVLCVLSKPQPHAKIPEWEMHLSAGAVCQNLLSAALALGYGAQWVTHWYAYNNHMIAELGGDPQVDKVAGFIYIGTAMKSPAERKRPNPNAKARHYGASINEVIN